MKRKPKSIPLPFDEKKPNPVDTRTYGTFNIDSVYENLIQTDGCPFYGLASTSHVLEAYFCNLNPDYQRDHVWTDEQRGKFLGHLIEGGRTNHVIINVGEKEKMLYPKTGDPSSEILDGKQRVTTALMFEQNLLPAILSDGRKVFINDMDKGSMTALRMQIGMTYQIVKLNRVQTLRLYLKLNTGGTIHSQSELAKVRKLLADEGNKL